MNSITTNLFILTKHWQDINNKLLITFYAYSSELGPLRLIFSNEKCLFFIKRQSSFTLNGINFERKELKLKTPSNEDVDGLYFNSYQDYTTAIRHLKAQNIVMYENDIDPAERFLMERFIHCECEIFGNADKTNNQITTFVNPKIRSKYINPDFKIASIDIETGVQTNELYSISAFTNENEEIVFMKGSAKGPSPNFIHYCADEKSLLKSFFAWLHNTDPDLIIGWHVIGFDFKFIFEKCEEHHIPFTLGRLHERAQLFQKANGNYGIEIPGRIVIDGPMALKSSFIHFDFYGLDFVAEKVLGEGKIIQETSTAKIDEINRLFKHDKVALARYNLKDSILVMKIFQKLDLVSLLIQRSKLSGMLLNQTGRSAASYDHLYLPRLHRKGYVAISLENIERASAAKGGYVISPRAGIHENIVIIDFKSLYPSIIRSFNIDPYSIIKRNSNPVKTPAGLYFSRDFSILPEIIEKLFKKRTEAKKKGNKPLSTAIKILMNSFYGVMGSYGCRFYHPDLPRAITETGQFILKESKSYIEKNDHTVIYGDTDSLFIKLNHVEKDYIVSRGKELVESLNNYWKNRLESEFDLKSYLEAEFESYYDKIIFTTMRHADEGAKKRYAGYLKKDDINAEIHFTGLESVRSDWTELAKKFQYELYMRVFENRDVQTFINQFVDDVFQGKYDSKLVYHKRLRKKIEEYTKTVPQHVRAAQKMKVPAKDVFYIITQNGPEPIDNLTAKADHQHYVDKQLQPIADAILPFLHLSFEKIVNRQITLFD